MLSVFKRNKKAPLLSVVVVSYNMAREIPRTVMSFLPPYQKGVKPADIEIIVMENGSSKPVAEKDLKDWPENVRYIKVKDPHPSPAKALNEGVALAKGKWVCPVIDGARMITPGFFNACQDLIKTHPNPIIATIGYHLGDQLQQLSVKNGYNQAIEDELLESINWPQNPYRLFNISCVGGSASSAWFGPIAESNVLVLKKELYTSLGGYDEKFDIPGGGLVNLDFFKRIIEHKETQYCLLIGEGNFHQYHGGVTTSRPVSASSPGNKELSTWDIYAQQYEEIRQKPFTLSQELPILYGQLAPEEKNTVLNAALVALKLKNDS